MLPIANFFSGNPCLYEKDFYRDGQFAAQLFPVRQMSPRSTTLPPQFPDVPVRPRTFGHIEAYFQLIGNVRVMTMNFFPFSWIAFVLESGFLRGWKEVTEIPAERH